MTFKIGGIYIWESQMKFRVLAFDPRTVWGNQVKYVVVESYSTTWQAGKEATMGHHVATFKDVRIDEGMMVQEILSCYGGA